MNPSLFRLTLFLFCHSFLTSLAAEPIDSLKILLKNSTHDTTRVRLLLQLSALHAERNIPLAIGYAEQAIAITHSDQVAGSNTYGTGNATEEKIKELAAQTELQSLKLKRAGQVTAGIITAAVMLLVLSWLFFRDRENLFQETRQAAELQLQVSVTLKENLRDAQLTAARAQMDPHFVFNAINAIQNLILKENKVEAITYLNDFSRLARQTLDNAAKDSVTINEEVAFLERYIQLEQLRNGFSFSYKIETENIDGDYDHIPTMLVQPLVENAIRHGLVPRKERGTLHVQFMKLERENLTVIVDDNGVGRRAAVSRSPGNHEPMAMHLTELRTRLLNDRKERRANYPIHVEDKIGPDGNPQGTRITLTIPFTRLQFTA